MAPPKRAGRAGTVLKWTIEGSAALVGLGFGFDFGARLGGWPLGVLAAGCGAAFCVMMVSGIAERLVRALGGGRDAR
jgi:hypothetical protein